MSSWDHSRPIDSFVGKVGMYQSRFLYLLFRKNSNLMSIRRCLVDLF